MKLQKSTAPMILVIASLLSQFCFAGTAPATSPGDDFATARDFFTVSDGSRRFIKESSPIQWFQNEALPALEKMAASDLPLMSWKQHDSAPSLPTEAYNRKKHFGTWIVDSSSGTCYNTRARVLIRDSRIPVRFKEKNKCVVESGQWMDPYTGHLFTSTQDLQIDHVVPLKHAYMSGAWAWNKKKRCMYANFMADNYHLRSVSGHENMSKGDASPAGYLPPDRNDICGYVSDWLKIKVAWNLILTPAEAKAIEDAVAENHCAASDMQMSLDELKALRVKILALNSSCKDEDNGGNEDPHNFFQQKD